MPRSPPARMNKRAVNIKQNDRTSGDAARIEDFRENIQVSFAGLQIWERWRPAGGWFRGLAGETPALPGNSGPQASDCAFRPQA